jgi:hypothetical protein
MEICTIAIIVDVYGSDIVTIFLRIGGAEKLELMMDPDQNGDLRPKIETSRVHNSKS